MIIIVIVVVVFMLIIIIMPAVAVSVLPAIAEAVAAVEATLGESGRVLLRPSGTEPVVRVMIEGVDGAQVKTLCASLAEDVERILSQAPAENVVPLARESGG